jgi:DNA-binding transcriptional regulator GbsR (MarR family)
METTDLEKEFIRISGEVSAEIGLNRTAGEIYGLLYISCTPLSLDDFVRKLEVSKASASLNVRELERWGAVRKIWKRGTRKDYYEAESDFLTIFYQRIRNRIRKMIGIFALQFSSYENSSDINETQKNRLKVFKNIYQIFTLFEKNLPEKISLEQAAALPELLSFFDKGSKKE